MSPLSKSRRAGRPHPAIMWLLLGFATAPVCGLDVPPAFSTCIDFHCNVTVPVTLTGAQWQRVRTFFPLHTTPAQERESIRHAVASLEEMSGRMTGTWRDKAGNFFLGSRNGQLDCIAESLNTTTYLRLLERAGLLHWHTVEARVMRRRWLVSAHWTAVIHERNSDSRFAVDSWYLDNGELPCVQPLADWRSGALPAECEDRDSKT